MKPWHQIGTAQAPDGGQLALWQRDRDFVIRVNGADLMSSRQHGSEEAMAEVADEAISAKEARVLIGGLGFGYTLRATLDRLGRGGKVVVAELFGAVIAWNRGPVAHLAEHPLKDPRVTVEEADVQAVLRRDRGRYDAVLLDVDNGPWALTTAGNRSLTQAAGLAALRQALRPGGTVVLWSAGPDPRFVARLRAGGFDVQVKEARAQNGRGSRHVLFVARPRPLDEERGPSPRPAGARPPNRPGRRR